VKPDRGLIIFGGIVTAFLRYVDAVVEANGVLWCGEITADGVR